MRSVNIWIFVAVALVAAFFYVQRSKMRYAVPSEGIFTGDLEAVHRVSIRSGGALLELIKADSTWRIAGHDSLEIRQGRVDDLENRVLGVKRSTVMTEREEKWATYSVDDSTGTHLVLMDAADGTLGEFVFGRSRSDWSKSYVRLKTAPTVYLTDNNVTNFLSTEPTYWGEVPAPPEEAADSAGVAEPSRLDAGDVEASGESE